MDQHQDESTPDLAEQQREEDLPLVELETMLNRPLALGKRVAQIVFVLIASLLLLIMLWDTAGTSKQIAPENPLEPINTPPMMFITSDVNFGTLTINGQKQSGMLPLWANIHSDTYDIHLDAPPFRQLSCHVRLSQVPSSGASIGSRECLAFGPSGDAPEFRIYLLLTLDDLPPAQQNQLIATLTQTLTWQQDLTVPAGSYVATSFDGFSITSQRSTATLHASASVAPITLQQIDSGIPCTRFICPEIILGGASAFARHQWAIQIELALRWRFSKASGALVSNVLFQGDNPFSQIETPVHLYLSLSQAGDWTVSQSAPVHAVSNQLQNAFCSVGETILLRLTGNISTNNVAMMYDQGPEGCEWQIFGNATDRQTFLWRFGVLLAADASTHAVYPQLPIASPAEASASEML